MFSGIFNIFHIKKLPVFQCNTVSQIKLVLASWVWRMFRSLRHCCCCCCCKKKKSFDFKLGGFKQVDGFSPRLQTWNSGVVLAVVMYIQCESGEIWWGRSFTPIKDTPATDAIYRLVRISGENNESQQSEQQRFDKLNLGDVMPYATLFFRLRQRVKFKS